MPEPFLASTKTSVVTANPGGTGRPAWLIVPSEAHAKVSFRLVADQRPAEVEDAFRAWVAERLPDGLRHEVTFMGGVRPCLTPLDHPAVQAAARVSPNQVSGAEQLLRRAREEWQDNELLRGIIEPRHRRKYAALLQH